MPFPLALLGTVILVAVGVWTVLHPDGGYRGAAGVGSGLQPSTRRAAGYGLIVFALVVLALAAWDAGVVSGR